MVVCEEWICFTHISDTEVCVHTPLAAPPSTTSAVAMPNALSEYRAPLKQYSFTMREGSSEVR